MESLSFWAGGLVAVTAAILTVTRRNAVASVIWLVVAFVGMSVLFFGMDAGFIGVVQLLVYAGAIMVLFLFVVMLLNLTPAGVLRIDRPQVKIVGLASAAALVAVVIAMVARSRAWTAGGTEAEIALRSGGSIVAGDVLPVADRLFDRWLLPFEATSVLLLVAIVGAVALTKKKL